MSDLLETKQFYIIHITVDCYISCIIRRLYKIYSLPYYWNASIMLDAFKYLLC